MDQYLFDSWQKGAPPFDGFILCHRDSLPRYFLRVEELREALTLAVTELQEECGDAPLVALEDWHEHDGVLLPGREATWQDVQNALVSNVALYGSRDDDYLVHRAFYPSGGSFLLRYDLLDRDDAPDHGVWGTFDLAAPITQLEKIVSNCSKSLRAKLRIENAKQYFDSKSAG